MRYTYRLVQADGSFVAECVEIEAEGEGATAKAAIDSLRQAIKERMGSSEAVAPPSMPPSPEIELMEAASPQRSVSPQGPGEQGSSLRVR